jgi:hypothetical protein
MAALSAATVPGVHTNRQYYPWGMGEGHSRRAQGPHAEKKALLF